METGKYNRNTLLSELTVGEFCDLVQDVISRSAMPKRLVTGIENIALELGVSESTVKRLKRSVLKPAVAQSGRTVIMDVNKAHEIMVRLNRR